MSEGSEKFSKKSRSSSSWIRSTIIEILERNKDVVIREEGFPREELVNQLLIVMNQNNVKKEAKSRGKVEKLLEKLLSKGIIGQTDFNGKYLIVSRDKGSKNRKRKATLITEDEITQSESEGPVKKPKNVKHRLRPLQSTAVDYRYILAPMVGASELAFRLLCRKYGATLAYTPMICSKSFARDESYRRAEFQTIPEDRPLVVHFSANDPEDFATSAELVQHQCDAIDLNLGCPQRTAYLGHFGSYLLDPKDRNLIVAIVRRAREKVSIPIFCKIRLLDTIEDTIRLCKDLRDAGASLIAVHARYRATWDRKGPGARDGPALLDQVKVIKQALSDIPIITNGNIKTFEDCERNLEFTKADGVMSAEGILDNPALFFPRYQKENSIPMVGGKSQRPLPKDNELVIKVKWPAAMHVPPTSSSPQQNVSQDEKIRKLQKKMKSIEKLEGILKVRSLNEKEQRKLMRKPSIETEINALKSQVEQPNNASLPASNEKFSIYGTAHSVHFKFDELCKSSKNTLDLAKEYIALAHMYPTSIRTVIFHIRRMCRDVLNKYQMMEDCISCGSIENVESILSKCEKYLADPSSFHFDVEKQKREKEALEKKKREEGKRNAFEARMIRKAKREGLSDVEYYLRLGSKIPTMETITALKNLSKEKQLELWKRDHSQHCLSYHLNPEGCSRNRACAFLHMDAVNVNAFNEMDEVAG